MPRARSFVAVASLASVLWTVRSDVVVADSYRPVIDPANFTTTINNPYSPLRPHTTFTYRGVVAEGTEVDTVEVTKYTKVIMGVTCVVVRDTSVVNGALAELTDDYFAQDKQGNVWYFGEDTKEYANGVVVSTEGTWEAGVNGAQPGIVMEANPQVGDAYRQEFSKGVAEDMAQVLSTNETITVPYGTFTNCLMTKEWSPLDKKVVEYKWYAPGVGFVKSTMVQGGSETSDLVKVTGP
jgi:hypothetical protein